MRNLLFLFILFGGMAYAQGLVRIDGATSSDAQEIVDTLSNRLGRGPGTAVDTLRGPYNATPYAQYDVKQDSVAKWLVFDMGVTSGVITNVYMTCDTANATNNTRRLLLVADTTGWGALTADNAAFALTAAKAGKIIGEPAVVALRTMGTGSDASHGGTLNYQWFKTAIGTKLFGIILMDAAYTGKKRETSTVKLSFEKY